MDIFFLNFKQIQGGGINTFQAQTDTLTNILLLLYYDQVFNLKKILVWPILYFSLLSISPQIVEVAAFCSSREVACTDFRIPYLDRQRQIDTLLDRRVYRQKDRKMNGQLDRWIQNNQKNSWNGPCMHERQDSILIFIEIKKYIDRQIYK